MTLSDEDEYETPYEASDSESEEEFIHCDESYHDQLLIYNKYCIN